MYIRSNIVDTSPIPAEAHRGSSLIRGCRPADLDAHVETPTVSTACRVSANLRDMPLATTDPWQALADPTRRQVLTRVAGGPCSVTEIASELPVSRPAVSQHLRVLLDARLVDVRRQGRQRVYQMRPDGLVQLRQELDVLWRSALSSFKDLAEQTYRPAATEPGGKPSP